MNAKDIISAGLELYEATIFFRNINKAKNNWPLVRIRETNKLLYQLVKAALIAQTNKRIDNG